jgi:putative transposase
MQQSPIVLKKEGQQGFQVLPKRWVVERTNACVSRNRRLARDFERLGASSKSFIYAAMTRLGLRRLARKHEFLDSLLGSGRSIRPEVG